MTFVVQLELASLSLYVAICDSYRVNIESKGGVIHNQQMVLAWSQRCIYQLYCNELPFWELLDYYHGMPSGPKNWQKVIVQQIKDPVLDFSVIDFPPIIFFNNSALSEKKVGYS